MIALLILVLAPSAPSQLPARQATATVRLERPAVAGPRQWREAPPSERRDVRRIDERGQAIRIRIIDFP